MTPFGDEGFAVLRELFRYDKEVPLEARLVDRIDEPESVREKLVFRGIRDSRVPAYFALPTHGEPPYPCAVLLHGIGGSKEGWWLKEASHSGRLLTDGLLAAGYCVPPLMREDHSPIAIHHYAPRITTQPFLLLVAEEDPANTTPEEARRLHDRIKRPTKEIGFYKGSHLLPPEWTGRAVEWMQTAQD